MPPASTAPTTLASPADQSSLRGGALGAAVAASGAAAALCCALAAAARRRWRRGRGREAGGSPTSSLLRINWSRSKLAPLCEYVGTHRPGGEAERDGTRGAGAKQLEVELVPVGPGAAQLQQLAQLREELQVHSHRIDFSELGEARGCELGRGSFGVVSMVSRRTVGDDVAMKQPAPRGAAEPEGRALRREIEFFSEALNHCQMRSLQIVAFLGWGEDGAGRPAVFLELCHGGTLAACSRRHTLRPSQRVSLAAGAALSLSQALAYMHNIPRWAHMDVAGRNILLSAPLKEVDARAVAASCRLSDFGLAARFGAPAPLVSIPWSPPESVAAAHSARVATAAHDVWGIGCVCVECLSGDPPWYALYVQSKSEGRGLRGWMDSVIDVLHRGDALPEPPMLRWHRGAAALWAAVVEPCARVDPGLRAGAGAVQQLARRACDLMLSCDDDSEATVSSSEWRDSGDSGLPPANLYARDPAQDRFATAFTDTAPRFAAYVSMVVAQGGEVGTAM